MNFTQDWFSYNIPHIEQLMGLLPARKRFLEIGCFEGRATCWFLQNALDDDGEMYCVDPFEGSMEHADLDLSDLYATFNQNVSEVKKPNQSIRTQAYESYRAVAKLITEKQQFDFIYIDGDHTAGAVLTDACMAWPLLKSGGIMLFDDYHWNPDGYNEYQKPKIGVDAFSHVFKDQFKVVHDGYQIAVQKI
jgi:predicted O-methyltransferase YrrM